MATFWRTRNRPSTRGILLTATIGVAAAGLVSRPGEADSPRPEFETPTAPLRTIDWLPARKSNELRVHFLNIGAGTCSVVECPGSGRPAPLVVDCGSLGGSDKDMSANDAKSYIEEINGSRKPVVVISHADQDHYGYIPTVLSDIRASHIWQGGNPAEYSKSQFPAWITAQEKQGARLHRDFDADESFAKTPAGLTCGTASTQILTVNSGESKNAQSLVLRIVYRDFSVVFTGDAEGVTESQAIENFSGDVHTTIVTGSHHGARTHGSNSQGWAEATDPAVVIFSAGLSFGHPQCSAVERFWPLTNSGASHPTRCGVGKKYQPVRSTTKAVYMTEVNGAIAVTSAGKSPVSLRCNGSAGCNTTVKHQ